MAVYLALAVWGAFVFMLPDTPWFEGPAGPNADHGVFWAALARPVECLAAGASKDRSFSPPHQCLSRMAEPVIFFAAGAGPVRSAVMAAAQSRKSAVPVKLRI
jgi:hypothetical protein